MLSEISKQLLESEETSLNSSNQESRTVSELDKTTLSNDSSISVATTTKDSFTSAHCNNNNNNIVYDGNATTNPWAVVPGSSDALSNQGISGPAVSESQDLPWKSGGTSSSVDVTMATTSYTTLPENRSGLSDSLQVTTTDNIASTSLDIHNQSVRNGATMHTLQHAAPGVVGGPSSNSNLGGNEGPLNGVRGGLNVDSLGVNMPLGSNQFGLHGLGVGSRMSPFAPSFTPALQQLAATGNQNQLLQNSLLNAALLSSLLQQQQQQIGNASSTPATNSPWAALIGEQPNLARLGRAGVQPGSGGGLGAFGLHLHNLQSPVAVSSANRLGGATIAPNQVTNLLNPFQEIGTSSSSTSSPSVQSPQPQTAVREAASSDTRTAASSSAAINADRGSKSSRLDDNSTNNSLVMGIGAQLEQHGGYHGANSNDVSQMSSNNGPVFAQGAFDAYDRNADVHDNTALQYQNEKLSQPTIVNSHVPVSTSFIPQVSKPFQKHPEMQSSVPTVVGSPGVSSSGSESTLSSPERARLKIARSHFSDLCNVFKPVDVLFVFADTRDLAILPEKQELAAMIVNLTRTNKDYLSFVNYYNSLTHVFPFEEFKKEIIDNFLLEDYTQEMEFLRKLFLKADKRA
ncbi:uncharacterized protein LOC142344715 isoform X2 [Convolutriloba macropyga]|uniref:uncharacterized protein LOC142344715 isoform X2 n=1 Tax=Convolutriloba macropyga TaxID=536237 RepID=UPI003F52553C